MARRLCDSGRIRIGSIYARVRHTELPPSCFCCLGFGHFSRDCVGQDKTNVCWKCDEAGHFGRDCAASPVAQVAFRGTIGGSGRLRRQEPQVTTADDTQEDPADRGDPTQEIEEEKQDD